MNKVYRLVWSYINRCLVPVAEGSRGRGKGGASSVVSGHVGGHESFALTAIAKALAQATGFIKPLAFGSVVSLSMLGAVQAEDVSLDLTTGNEQQVQLSNASGTSNNYTVNISSGAAITADGVAGELYALFLTSSGVNSRNEGDGEDSTSTVTISNSGVISFVADSDSDSYGSLFYSPTYNDLDLVPGVDGTDRRDRQVLGGNAIEISTLGEDNLPAIYSEVDDSVTGQGTSGSSSATVVLTINNTGRIETNAGDVTVKYFTDDGEDDPATYGVSPFSAAIAVVGHAKHNESGTYAAIAANDLGSDDLSRVDFNINNDGSGSIVSENGEAVFVGSVTDSGGNANTTVKAYGIYAGSSIDVDIENATDAIISGKTGGVIFETRNIVGGVGLVDDIDKGGESFSLYAHDFDVDFTLNNAGDIVSASGRAVAVNDVYAGNNVDIRINNREDGAINGGSSSDAAIQIDNIEAGQGILTRVDNRGDITGDAGGIAMTNLDSADGYIYAEVNNFTGASIESNGVAIEISQLYTTTTDSEDVVVNVNNWGDIVSDGGQAVLVADLTSGETGGNYPGGRVSVEVVNKKGATTSANSSSAAVEVNNLDSPDHASVTITNDGTITNEGSGSGVEVDGVYADDQGSAMVTVVNTGTITGGSNGSAVEVYDVYSSENHAHVVINNAAGASMIGGLKVGGEDGGVGTRWRLNDQIGDYMETSQSRLNARVDVVNAGTIAAGDDESAIAVFYVDSNSGDAIVNISSKGATLSAVGGSGISVNTVDSTLIRSLDDSLLHPALTTTSGANAQVTIDNASSIGISAAGQYKVGGILVNDVEASTEFDTGILGGDVEIRAGGTLAKVNIQNAGEIDITTESFEDIGSLVGIGIGFGEDSGINAYTKIVSDEGTSMVNMGDTQAIAIVNNKAKSEIDITLGDGADVWRVAGIGVRDIRAEADADDLLQADSSVGDVLASVAVDNLSSIKITVGEDAEVDDFVAGIRVDDVYADGYGKVGSVRAEANVTNTGDITIVVDENAFDIDSSAGIAVYDVYADSDEFSGESNATVVINNNIGNISLTRGVDTLLDSNGIRVLDVYGDTSSVTVINSGNITAEQGINIDDVGGYVDVQLNAGPAGAARFIRSIRNAVDIDDIDGDNLLPNGDNPSVSVKVVVAKGVALESMEGDGISVSDVDKGDLHVVMNGEIIAGSFDGEDVMTDGNEGIDINLDGVGNVVVEINGDITAWEEAITIGDLDQGNATVIIGKDSTLLSLEDGASYSQAIRINRVVGDMELTNKGTVVGGVEMSEDGEDSGPKVKTNFDNEGTWRVGDYDGEDDSEAFYTDRTDAVITNSGTIEVTGDATFEGMTTFDNAGGVIDITHDDGEFSEVEFNFSGSTFSGGEGSTIMIDADLGLAAADGEDGQILATDSDSIVFTSDGPNGVTITGKTLIQITDGTPDVAGVNSPKGHVVITVDNAAAPAMDAFALAKPLNKGLWQYDLYGKEGEDDTTEYVLASTASHQAFELPVMLTSTQHTWQESTSTMRERMYELRAKKGADGAAVSGGWVKLSGSSLDRDLDNATTLHGKTNAVNNRYTQNYGGLQLGFDHVIERTDDSRWQLGLSAGLLQSDTRFKVTGTKMDADDTALGAYASYIQGGAFVNFAVNSTRGSIDYSMSNASLNADAGIAHKNSFDTKAMGASLEAGYRFVNPTWFFEPSVRIASTKATVEDKSFLMTDVDFANNARSVQSSLSLDAGYQTTWGKLRAEPFFQVSWFDVDSKNNKVSLISGGQSAVELSDNKNKGMWQLGAGVRLFEGKNQHGFIRINHKGNSDAKQTSVSGGYRYNW